MNTQDLQGKLIITRVSPDSPADKAGLAAGDIILGVRSMDRDSYLRAKTVY